MNDKMRSTSSDASTLIEAFLTANPTPTIAQWKNLTLTHPEYATQIADALVLFSGAIHDVEEPGFPVEDDLFNATRSGMLSAVHANTGPIREAKTALKQCKGPAARNFAREIGLGERVDLFNLLVSGEVRAPYVLIKRLAAKLHVRAVAMAEVFALNFQNGFVQAFSADGKPAIQRQPVSWEQAVKDAGISGDEATRLLQLEKAMD